MPSITSFSATQQNKLLRKCANFSSSDRPATRKA
jgi:hypothetical protein